jgi:hypothetical protein
MKSMKDMKKKLHSFLFKSFLRSTLKSFPRSAWERAGDAPRPLRPLERPPECSHAERGSKM